MTSQMSQFQGLLMSFWIWIWGNLIYRNNLVLEERVILRKVQIFKLKKKLTLFKNSKYNEKKVVYYRMLNTDLTTDSPDKAVLWVSIMKSGISCLTWCQQPTESGCLLRAWKGIEDGPGAWHTCGRCGGSCCAWFWPGSALTAVANWGITRGKTSHSLSLIFYFFLLLSVVCNFKRNKQI